MEIKTIGVVGAGQMGGGIAQVAATAGFHVVFNDIKDEFLARGTGVIEKSLSKLAEKGKLSEKPEAIRGRIQTTSKLEDLNGCDLIVEAAVESYEIKAGIFKRLDAIAPAHAILATNTSSISITKIAANTKRPEAVIGMHFMNPVPLMALVEMIRGQKTSDATYATVKAAAEKMGKTCAEVQDYPGFVSNRVLMPMINEAIQCLYEGVGTPESIDTVMKLGMNHPMGPLALADLIGLDTCLAIMNVLHDGFGDSKYRPCPLLVRKVASGELGRKTGQGFYKY